MALFSSAPALDDALATVTLPPEKRAYKNVAKVADSLKAALEPGETIRVIAGEEQPVTAVTDQRVLVLRPGQFRATTLDDVREVDVNKPLAFVVTAEPGIKAAFHKVEHAMSFAALLEPRDVPMLYPEFFTSLLAEVGLPATAMNLARLQQMVARQVAAGGAFAYLDQAGDGEGRSLFTERFTNTRPLSPEELGTLADQMIDWLWQRNWRFHQALRDLVPSIRRILTEPESVLRGYDEEIPETEW